MGLDLMMYKKSDFDNKDIDLVEEILYGRKTWFLYNWFKNFESSVMIEEDVYEIQRDAFEAFYIKLIPYKDYIRLIADKPEDKCTELDYTIAEEICNLLDDGDQSVLGYIWDVTCLYHWLLQMYNVMKIYEGGDKLIMLASY